VLCSVIPYEDPVLRTEMREVQASEHTTLRTGSWQKDEKETMIMDTIDGSCEVSRVCVRDLNPAFCALPAQPSRAQQAS
jgi:hypothetical protein